ncbi:MAG: hypothetical protein CBB97_06745 [Candidatus Endolissoclinum sp. TMED37]|nr:MAG: hypothetical protein CBB97_06745 [Candidatus Endolissoclinum sp. TMED37]
MFSIVICTRKRSDQLLVTLSLALRLLPLEIVVVVNDCKDTMNALSNSLSKKIKVIENDENIGAGRAKHLGILNAKSNRILVLDDDAEILEQSDIKHCLKLLEDYALVQGLIVANKKLERRSYEQPFLFRKNRIGIHEIGYFVGACHFINREKFLRAGGYENAALYGFEELELSLNLLLNNERLIFTDKFVVHHKKNAKGRMPDEVLKIRMLEERVRIASEYYPIFFAFISSLIWNFRTFGRVKFKYLPSFHLKNRIKIWHFLTNRFFWIRALF